MAVIQDHVDIQAILQSAQAAAKNFGIQLFLVDDDQIPVDQRFRYTTKTSFATDFTSGTVPYAYSNVFFGQKRKATELMIGRWVSAASNVYFICGAAYETDYEVWELVTDGSFDVTDGTNTEAITGVDFSGATSFNDILTILNAELAALVAPTVTGLDSAEFKVDSLGRLILEMPTTGSSAPTVTIESNITGTDLAAAAYFDAANGTAVAGVDAEDPIDAETIIDQLDSSYYNVGIRGESSVQAVSLAQQIEAKEKLLDLFVTDANAKSAAATTDVGYQCAALNLKRTMCYYSERTAEYPDAAVAGNVLPTEEGSTNFAHQDLALVSDSGLNQPLTITERNALKDKNYVWIERITPYTIMYPGITSGGEEKRVMIGRDWFVARIREALFTDLVNSPLHAFDNPTMTKVENIIRAVGAEAIDRAIIVNTPERPFIVDIPDADEFTAAQRASHTAELQDVFTCYINSAINDYIITGTWTLYEGE